MHTHTHTYIQLTHNFVACSCKLVVQKLWAVVSSREQSSWGTLPWRRIMTSYHYRRQAATVPTTSYNHTTTALRLRKTEILVADGRLKVLNISKLRGDRRKLRQTRRPHKTTYDHTGDNRARKSRTTLQNKVRLKVLPEQLTLSVNTSVTLKNASFNSFLLYRPDYCSEIHALSYTCTSNEKYR